MRSVELFVGAGGLAMGASLAGFRPEVVVEWDRWACDTLRANKARGYPLVGDWNIHEGDVRAFDWNSIEPDIDLLTGGPPCQPFSLGGKHRAHDDSRDMFPATVDVVRRLRPKAFVIENVKGLTRSSFHSYFQYVQLQLKFPEKPRRLNEDWYAHYLRLQAEDMSGEAHGRELTYRLEPNLVNAADYGVPQRRERVFIIGFRYDLQTTWQMPKPTHSYESLLFDQWVTGTYWDRAKVAKWNRPSLPASLESTVRRLRQGDLLQPRSTNAWVTVREALALIPNPLGRRAKEFLNHRFQPGARPYPGHTGSPLDLPAKTLKAGGHGVPGGENMMDLGGGCYRYFTVRESAVLQTFPLGYELHGAWGEAMRQLGNAVPVLLAEQVASSVAVQLVEAQLRKMGFNTTDEVRTALLGRTRNTTRHGVA